MLPLPKKGIPVPTEWTTTGPMPPEGPDWATLSRQFVEVRDGSEIYRRGHVDDTMPDGSGLRMAADGILGRELIWREQGFTVGKLHRPAAGIQPQLDAASGYASGFQEGPLIPGGGS
jgi:hypothetical protein